MWQRILKEQWDEKFLRGAVCTSWPLIPDCSAELSLGQNAGQCVLVEEVKGWQLKDLGSQSSCITDPLSPGRYLSSLSLQFLQLLNELHNICSTCPPGLL